MEEGLKNVCMCWFSLARRGAAKARWGRHTRTRREVEGRRPNRTCASITHVEASFRRPSSNEGIELKSRVFFDTPLLRHVFRPPGPADALPCADPLQYSAGRELGMPKSPSRARKSAARGLPCAESHLIHTPCSPCKPLLKARRVSRTYNTDNKRP
jgi:hypothetical protein